MANQAVSAAFAALDAHRRDIERVGVAELFAADPGRFERFHVRLDDLLFDFSKHRIDQATLPLLLAPLAPGDNGTGKDYYQHTLWLYGAIDVACVLSLGWFLRKLPQRDMILAVRDRVSVLIEQNKTLEEVIAAKPTADFDAAVPQGKQTAERFLTWLYAEVKAGR